MANISQIQSGVVSGSALASSIPALAGLLIASPNAKNTIGYQPQNTAYSLNPSLKSQTLVFHYEGEQTVSLESDVTDHFIEDNTSVQDQVALRPEIITTHGFIGDLNNVPANAALAALQIAANALTSVSGYLPGLSVTALEAYNTAVLANSTITAATQSAVSAYNSLSGNGGESVINGNSITLTGNQTPQQQYFQQFYAYWATRTQFTVQTPWAIFQNCIIKNLRAIQDADTRTITDFEVTFKVLRFASTQTVVSSSLLGNQSGRAANQAVFQINFGTATPPITPTTLINGLSSTLGTGVTI